ncbi:MAG: tellurium resistance protein TerC [Psychrobium sp.]|nr:tellurium resistance protein TerC [Psychrobium sp.]
MKSLRKLSITLVGGFLLLFAIIFIALPGTVIILPIALAILALEYEWARRYVKVAQKMLTKSAALMDKFVQKWRSK